MAPTRVVKAHLLFERQTKILTKVKPVSDLDCLRSPFPNRLRI